MRRITAIPSLPALLILPLPLMAETYRFSATAETFEGKPLYQEQHSIGGECVDGRFRARSHAVDYVALDSELGTEGEAFASKSLDYEYGRQRPSVDFRQPLFDERMQITNVDDTEARIVWNTPGGDTQNDTVPLSPDVVIDSGFVHFIRDHWSTLTDGRQVDFRFLAPTRGEAYRFVAEPTDNQEIDAYLVVSMLPSQMFLRWVVDPILVGFDERGRITDYRGLGNIRKDEDRNYTVHLRYDTSEPPCPLLPR
ncbi:hypothetical protein RE428_22800 [Marinobacter nanhaiticus D15-8W]|uniref:DUF3108 domain-containing protein n=1 Tax=Marinobacter nanhaiticus D15-8W TaxID=626887 RepID=N6VUP7_9GAMM|nr:hypothetical protein [Marinobacter nanhaiticus]ENO13885.1 hypothetical protein J057_20855 [Marinobacter nanhaiticus D15-8W]BES71262.1 hypothetical protein RE428_22800 [Marinobacter nanhaiticus D15-8W]